MRSHHDILIAQAGSRLVNVRALPIPDQRAFLAVALAVFFARLHRRPIEVTNAGIPRELRGKVRDGLRFYRTLVPWTWIE